MTTPHYPLADTVRDAFTQQYGATPAAIVRAPGRINLIGEHTDYNDGFVLPAAIDRAVFIAGTRRADRIVRVHSVDYKIDVQFTLDDLQAQDAPPVTLYPRGASWILQQEGQPIGGMDLAIVSDIPSGAGLSSSAAMGVAMLTLMCALFHITTYTPTQIAMLSVQIEHNFVGVRTGNMDQLISALGLPDHALLIDCRSLHTTPVPLSPQVSWLILDTTKRRELTHTEYGMRRQQCEEAAKLLGVPALRDVTPAMLENKRSVLSDVLYKRAKHVVEEDKRTLEMVDVLNKDDLHAAGQLLNASHASLRDLFQISIPELDIMADLAQHAPGCYGARMMGGGFGGSVLALVPNADAERVSTQVAAGYQAATGLTPIVYVGHASAGCSLVD